MKMSFFCSNFSCCAAILVGALGVASNVAAVENTSSTKISTLTSLAHSASNSDAQQKWVHGSLVNVRTEPAAKGTVIAQLKVNTPVRLTLSSAQNGYCEIAWGENQHGFVSCQLLGDKVLSLEEVSSEYLPDGRTPNPNYSAPRAFWIEPNLERLLAAGRYFESRFLSAEEQAREQQFEGDWNTKPAPRRFSIPEFEAMKAAMRNGIVEVISAPDPNRLPSLSRTLASWKKIKAIANQGNPSDHFSMYNELRSLHLSWGLRDPSVGLLQALELPNVKASLFKNENEIGRPMAKTEEISAKFSIPYQATALTGPQWIPGGHYNGAYVFGAWDIGAIETHLTRDVYKHTIYSAGKITSERTVIKGGRFPPSDADGSECNLGYSLGDASPKVWRGLASSNGGVPAHEKGSGKLFYFYTKEPLQYSQVKVTKQAHKFLVDGFVSATSTYFDIDSDGVMDFLVWEGIGKSKQEIHDPGSNQPHYRMMFININAEWYLLEIDEFLYGCGC